MEMDKAVSYRILQVPAIEIVGRVVRNDCPKPLLAVDHHAIGAIKRLPVIKGAVHPLLEILFQQIEFVTVKNATLDHGLTKWAIDMISNSPPIFRSQNWVSDDMRFT